MRIFDRFHRITKTIEIAINLSYFISKLNIINSDQINIVKLEVNVVIYDRLSIGLQKKVFADF